MGITALKKPLLPKFVQFYLKYIINGVSYRGGRSSTDWTGDGTSISPYLINRASQLAGLSISVNYGTIYAGKYFKLGIDLKTHNVKCEYRR